MVDVRDERVTTLIDPAVEVERLGGDAIWSEGPVWLPEDEAVIWSDVPNNRILRWTERTREVTVERTDVEYTNGRTLDVKGRVVACSHGRRAVERTEADGTNRVLVDRYGPSQFNSPNDVVVSSDGAVWFTDPPYGILKPDEGHPGVREYSDHYVFRFDPETGELTPVIMDMEWPNGLAFSPDERLLYVSDTSRSHSPQGNHWIRAYDVEELRRCKNGRLFANVTPGLPDGFRVDADGNVWTSSEDSVQVYAPEGTLLGKIPVPERVANVCFGGSDGSVLYIAASTTLYRVPTKTKGSALWGHRIPEKA
jgi:gluconolactonase